ncbi:MAG: apolipoprotein N-acyltransferase [Alphaproteobacteria bacterium]|nr:apolipoprotein N-acyltransferase [Alphaproteobacteria bacterium]MBU0797599.1 apolipoprotein N-acyltransferase [Alphaproteobacteria bacterium]MBU0886613.1 apolipoprotein N-acyltransferase [Alphaproteobacteria bacterium]MBU1812586.1 apolipoprotein N-acyltransferase [Alphaproteobacteria bacterium]
MVDVPESQTRAFARLPIRIGVAFGGGAASVLALPPFSLIVLVPVAWSALLICLPGLSLGRATLVGWAFGVAQFGFGIPWVAESFYVDADRFGALAIPAVAGLSAFLALFPALATALFAHLSRHIGTGLPAALLLATAWTGAEWLRGHMLTGFPWNLAGYAVADFDALRQPAAWAGSYGMSFLVVLAGALPAAAWAAKGNARHFAGIAGLALPLALWAAGEARLNGAAPPPTGVSLRVVQGNFPQAEKWVPGARERALDRYTRLSVKGGPVNLVLWPETAFPGFLDEDADARARIAAALPEGALLMTGAPDRVETEAGTRYFNAVQVYDRGGEILAEYAKHHLVPFGEYMPLPNWLPVERIVESPGDFTPGPGPRTLSLPGVPVVGPTICYEIIFPGHITEPRFRPDWIFNATNDAWFGTSIGPKQHLASARMRAVEEGLPVIRAANTGISAVIDATGDIRSRLDTGETGIIDAELPPALRQTLYARFGEGTLAALIALAWALVIGFQLAARCATDRRAR